MAIGAAFNTAVATVMEVTGTSLAAFRISRVWLAVDSYLTVKRFNA